MHLATSKMTAGRNGIYLAGTYEFELMLKVNKKPLNHQAHACQDQMIYHLRPFKTTTDQVKR